MDLSPQLVHRDGGGNPLPKRQGPSLWTSTSLLPNGRRRPGPSSAHDGQANCDTRHVEGVRTGPILVCAANDLPKTRREALWA